jgi:Na+-driven multidrug efflux pump
VKDTSRQPVVWAIAALAGPAVLAFLLPNFYHVNDAYFLGKVGPSALNAMGLFQFVSIANFGVILTLARGTQSLVARRFGAGNRAGCEMALAQGIRLALLVLVPLGVFEWIFIPEILELMGGTGETIVAGTAYVRCILVFLPALFLSPVIEFSFQALGDTKTPFKLQALAVSMNTLLNWLLVLPHEVGFEGGALRLDGWSLSAGWLSAAGLGDGSLGVGGLGVAGAAIATGFSRLLSAVVGFWVMVRRNGMHDLLRRSSYAADRRVAREVLRVGLPAGSSTLLYAVIAACLTKIIAGFGQDALGAYSIGFRGVEGVSFMVVLGFGAATATVVSHAVGAGDFVRARRAGHVGTAMACAVMVGATLLFLSLPEQLVGLFTDDLEILAMAVSYIGLMAFCQVPQALEMVYADAMAGAGSSTRAALVSIPGNLLRLPLALWLALGLGLGLEGVWYAIVTSSALKGLGMAWLYAGGSWEKGMHRGRELLRDP